jgi:hypothetical protein
MFLNRQAILLKRVRIRCRAADFPKLLIFRERRRNAGFSCYNVMPLTKNCYSTSLFTTGYKRLLEGGHEVFLMGVFG